MNQTTLGGGQYSQQDHESTLQHPLVWTDFHTTVRKRVALAKFFENFVSFPNSSLWESTQFPLHQQWLVLTLAIRYLSPAFVQDWNTSSASCSRNLASFARLELHIAIDLHCIVKCRTFGNQGETNRQGWRSDGQGEMPVLSEGDVWMGVNYISTPFSSSCSHIMTTFAVLSNLVTAGTQTDNNSLDKWGSLWLLAKSWKQALPKLMYFILLPKNMHNDLRRSLVCF